MFKKSKSKVLVECASEEDDMRWHHQHTYKDEEPDGEEETASPVSKDVKVKIKTKKEKKCFYAPDDEHFLLTGVSPAEARGKKNREEEKRTYMEKGHCFWDSVTMTMKQITPTRKTEKIPGWEAQSVGGVMELPEELVAGDDLVQCNDPPSWTELEGDLSKYASLSESRVQGVRWTTKAKDKLAGIRRRSISENWTGLK